MKNMKKILVNSMIFILIFSGMVLIGWHFIQDSVILYFTQVEINPDDFAENLAATEDVVEYDWDNVRQLELLDLLAYVDYEVHPIGELILPSIDVRLPVLQGPTNANMTLGAGTVRPGFVMGAGNYVLGSHWDPNPTVRFGGLSLIEIGDLIILRDADYLYLYETIIANYVIEPNRLDIVDEVVGKVYVTLFTCTPDGSQRVMVRGELVEQVLIADIQDAADWFQEREELANVIDMELFREVVEQLDESEVEFPTLEVAAVLVGSILIAGSAVWLSGKDFRRKEKADEIISDATGEGLKVEIESNTIDEETTNGVLTEENPSDDASEENI